MSNFKKYVEEQMLWEMANIRPNDSGLERTIYISDENAPHGARIKVSALRDKMDVHNTFSITISDTPKVIGKTDCSSKELEDIFDFIKINKTPLLKLWKREIGYKEFFLNMKSI